MKTAHAFKFDVPPVTPERTEGDLFENAESKFGASTHMVLVNDAGPTQSVMGWVLGSARVDVIEGPGESRTVVIDVVLTEIGKYAVAERVTRQTPAGKVLSATLSEFGDPVNVYRYVESAAKPADSARDAALAAALDHAARVWPPLKRKGRGPVSTPLPFGL